ncbi:MAG: cation:proton antiporter [Candidatus Ranarchaeia archaeon]
MVIDGYLLFIIAGVLIITFLGGQFFKKLGIPQVLGFMLSGLILGISFLNVINQQFITFFTFVISLSLGFIGYNVGNEIEVDKVKENWKQLTPILILQSIGVYFFVTFFLFIVSQNLPLSMILGSLAAATAPAATAEVVWEYKARGPVTESLMFILILDDIIAIVLANIALQLGLVMMQPELAAQTNILFGLLYEVGGSILLGIISGIIILKIIKKTSNQYATYLTLVISCILLVIGFAEIIHLSAILSCIILGMIVGNGTKKEERNINLEIEKITAPFIILFFALIGAQLDVSLFFSGITLTLISITYLVSRFFAKYIGTAIGGVIGKAPKQVSKYLGLCLLSQAGVAIGLAVEISNTFTNLGPVFNETGILILNVVGITTIINTMIGPLGVKYGLKKSRELKDVVPLTGDGGLARDF